MTAAGTPTPVMDREQLRLGLRIFPLPAFVVMVAMLLTAIAAHVLVPRRAAMPDVPNLDAAVPKSFGGWRETPSLYAQAAVVVPNRDTPSRDQPYDAVLMRNYVNDADRNGRPIMLALAYASEQRQDIKIHRPEVCYPAQGFTLLQQHSALFPMIEPEPHPVPGGQLLTRNRQRLEAVSYWIRIGDAFPRSAWAMRGQIFRDGIEGRISDGILVRVSTLIDDAAQAPAAYRQQQQFLAALVQAATAHSPGLLVPARNG